MTGVTFQLDPSGGRPLPVGVGALALDRYPGLVEALGALARALSVVASRTVTVTDPRPRQQNTTTLPTDDTLWLGSARGTIIGVPTRSGALADLLLGLAPDPDPRPLSPVEQRLLRRELLPLLQPVADTLHGQLDTDLSDLVADAVLAAVGRHAVLTTLDLTIATAAPTVAVPVTVAVALDSHQNRPTAPVDLENLTGPLARIPVRVTAALPPTLMPAGLLTELRPGSEFTLAVTADTPWLIRANGTLLGAGTAGQSRNRRSVQTTLTWRSHPMNEQVLAGIAAAQQAADHTATEPAAGGLGPLGNVEVEVAAELGRVTLPLREVAGLHPGQVLELDKAPDAPFTVVVNGVPFATAEAVIVGSHYGLRIIELVKQ